MTAPSRAAAPVVAARSWVVATALVLGTMLLALRDPNEVGGYPACPFRLATDLDCPACGSLRALHALMHGDPGRAVGHNVLTVAAVPVALLHALVWVRPAWAATWVGGFGRRLSSRAAGLSAIIVIGAFAVLRNLPWVPFSALQS